ncbi:MAG: cupredoxin domain-containing protein [Actinomycetota bacterium]|nr:cupredoxin domain-containing protein [Actinomycetota bacterium]
MHRRGSAIGALLVATIFIVTACSSGSSTSSAAGGSSSSSSQSEAPANVQGKSSTKVTAQNFFFSPSTLDGTAGQKLTITLDNEGTVAHNFSIDDQNISVTLQPGTEQDIEVTFPQSGSVQFYCVFHKANGMTGQLEVT